MPITSRVVYAYHCSECTFRYMDAESLDNLLRLKADHEQNHRDAEIEHAGPAVSLEHLEKVHHVTIGTSVEASLWPAFHRSLHESMLGKEH